MYILNFNELNSLKDYIQKLMLLMKNFKVILEKYKLTQESTF